MEKKSFLFDWRNAIKNVNNGSIGNDIILLDQPVITPDLKHPFRVDVTSVVICLKGSTKGTINLRKNEIKGPGLIVLLRDSVLQLEEVSDDFTALFIVMSPNFLNSLNIDEKIPAFLSIKKTPYIALQKEELDSLIDYYKMMQRIITYKDNPYQLNIARHLTIAFFYGVGYGFHLREQANVNNNKSRHDKLFDDFLYLVQKHFKDERSLDFYANELCLSSKHLSKVIKETSGKSPVEWIKEFVVQNAQALLKSSDLTVQQISDELNFPSQSFFGKYFKNAVGISPKNYRESKD
nr:helix-turn-helix domain-containing protein [uncultured Draconibacterium sp.]